MGVGIEQWRAAIGLYNAGRPRSRAPVQCHRTNLESTIDLLLQLASVDPTAALAYAKAMGTCLKQWLAVVLSSARGATEPPRSLDQPSNSSATEPCARSLDQPSSSSSWLAGAVATILRKSLVLCTATLMTALMLLILLSGDVERNPGPELDGERFKMIACQQLHTCT